jgi:hypothetical protein
MGTRYLTVFKDEDNKEIVVMYRQFDGYPEGHGEELRLFLGNIPITNGISGSHVLGSSFNGMGCLAASVIAYFKKRVGGFYLYPAETRNVGEEYVYIVENKDGFANITVEGV